MVLFLSSASIYFRLLPIPREGGIEGRSTGRNELAMEANQRGVASNMSEEVCDSLLIFVDFFLTGRVRSYKSICADNARLYTLGRTSRSAKYKQRNSS